MAVRILLVDDHKLFRDGLRPLLEEQAGWTVVGEADSGVSALRLAAELQPDVVLMDITMPDLNGIEALHRLQIEQPKIRSLVLSMHADRRFVSESLKAGAYGYLLKDCAFTELAQAIRAVIAGQYYLSHKISGVLIQDYVSLAKQQGASAFTTLSPREREVLQLISEGCATRVIAARLNVSVKTIETHRRQIMEKLDLHTVAELTKYAIREGLTTVE